MQLLIPGKSYAKKTELYASTEALVVTVVGADGTVLDTPAVTTLTGVLTLDEAAVPGDTYLTLIDGSSPNPGWYLPSSAWGRNPVEIVTYDAIARRAYLRDPLLVHIAESTTLSPITAYFTVVVPSTYTGDLVYLEYTSALRSQRETYLVSEYEFVSPFDLFKEIPRLQGQQVNRPDLLDVPQAAIDDLRGRLWSDAIKLDNCQIPSRCLPFVRAWVKGYLTEQGIDVVGGDVDRMDALQKFNQDMAAEYKNLVSAKIWHDAAVLARATPVRSGWRAKI